MQVDWGSSHFRALPSTRLLVCPFPGHSSAISRRNKRYNPGSLPAHPVGEFRPSPIGPIMEALTWQLPAHPNKEKKNDETNDPAVKCDSYIQL